jgi:Ca2+-binding EF-hand superfamily protein
MELDSVLTGTRHVDREQLKEEFKMVDESGAGEITFDQFKQLLKVLLGQ